MANNTKKKEVAPVVTTRAEKKDATKNLIRELLAKKEYKHNELIDEVAKLYVQRFESEETDNINDVKGRVGSVLDIMKKDEDVSYDGGRYALKEQKTVAAVIETPVLTEEVKAEKSAKKGAKTTRAKKALEKVLENTDDKNTADKKEETTVKEEKKAEKPAVKKTSRAKKTAVKEEKKQTEKPQEEEVLPLPPAPIQPIAPVAPITPEVAPEPIPEAAPTPKKRARKTKTVKEEVKAEVKEEVKGETPILAAISSEGTPMPETKAEEVKKEPKKEKDTPMSALKEEKAEEKTLILEEKPQTETAMVVKEKKEVAPKNVVMDMSFLFGDVKPARKTEKPVLAVAEEKVQTETVKEAESKDVVSTEPSAEEKFETQSSKEAVKKAENPAQSGARKKVAVSPAKTLTVAKGQPKKEQKDSAQQAQATNRRRVAERPAAKTLTADEKLREAYLKKLRSLGGDYFEYYSVYLLEKYSRRNGRRLEGLKITGGDHDGGIDGEIELTDKLGFRETIYIQSKNWNPDKGDERLWVVGETLLQQFIGACMCRQAKDGKQHCRGIFITTSRFTPDAKRILDDMSDKIVGYDGADLYEAAKECEFGVKYENGNWKLDEKLLSGTKAFFEML